MLEAMIIATFMVVVATTMIRAARVNAEKSTVAAINEAASISHVRRFRFIEAFGLRPECLKELHVYAVPGRFSEFPEKVVLLLNKLHREGSAIGAPIMGLVHHARPLRVDEAVYMAVIQDDAASAQRVVAFIHHKQP